MGMIIPKRRRNYSYHPRRLQCLPCILWRQSGSDPNLKHLHPQDNSRHVGTEAVPLAQYARFDNTYFRLTSDDCVCQPCHKDFLRKHNQENRIPRWAKVKHRYYSARENIAYIAVGKSASVKVWISGAQICGLEKTHLSVRGRNTYHLLRKLITPVTTPTTSVEPTTGDYST